MKIDFVGNSHLGTLAPALTKGGGAHEVSHFISRTYGSSTPSLIGNDGGVPLPYIKLAEPIRYGTTIDLRRSDVVVAVGLNFSLVQMATLWAHFTPVDAQGDYGVPSLSTTMWNAYVDAAFDATFMFRLLTELQRLGAAAVAVLPQPAPAEWVSHRDGGKFELYRQLVLSGDWDRVRKDFDRQLARLEERDLHVFRQPEGTLTELGFTRDEFAMGNASDTGEDSFYSRGDFYHMNRAFAQRVAPHFYEWLERVTLG